MAPTTGRPSLGKRDSVENLPDSEVQRLELLEGNLRKTVLRGRAMSSLHLPR
jgi:hypothetical protein